MTGLPFPDFLTSISPRACHSVLTDTHPFLASCSATCTPSSRLRRRNNSNKIRTTLTNSLTVPLSFLINSPRTRKRSRPPSTTAPNVSIALLSISKPSWPSSRLPIFAVKMKRSVSATIYTISRNHSPRLSRPKKTCSKPVSRKSRLKWPVSKLLLNNALHRLQFLPRSSTRYLNKQQQQQQQQQQQHQQRPATPPWPRPNSPLSQASRQSLPLHRQPTAHLRFPRRRRPTHLPHRPA